MFQGGIHCWDMVAGALIIEEAGGCVLNSHQKTWASLKREKEKRKRKREDDSKFWVALLSSHFSQSKG